MADTAPASLPTTYLTPPLYDTLKNKTYLGLLIAEFLAAFNDQCIHASAMFFALRKGVLSDKVAIALMPILFYSPWALFAPLSAYLADKVSKRFSLIFWKVAEVFITALAFVGFCLGVTINDPHHALYAVGPFTVMACVFLMGTHSTFYVPCKYGSLPELFTVRSLSRANGLVESTTFLAVILGTTAGGFLSNIFYEREAWIGVILIFLALIGTCTSLFIRTMPPANPTLPFPGWAPWQMFRPLFKNLGVLMRYRLSSIAVLGLAFFVFMVAFMRATMYMFGQSRNPRWDEQQTSLMVAVVSLGVGLGSPLAGFLSRGKVELGMVPLGALGMVLAVVIAGGVIFNIPALAVCLVVIGLFAGFYLVPLYSLLQYSAPKGSKGASVATSNFICTFGAILASGVFWTVSNFSDAAGITEPLPTREVVAGKLVEVDKASKGHHIHSVTVAAPDGTRKHIAAHVPEESLVSLPTDEGEGSRNDITLLEGVEQGAQVAVSVYTIRDTDYYQVRLADRPLPANYNKELLPRYLFFGAGVMMFGIITVLCVRQRDMLLRTLIWLRLLGKPPLGVQGYENLPTKPVILVTNACGRAGCLPLVAALVRPLRFVLPADDAADPVTGTLQRYAGLVFFRPDANGAEMQKVGSVAAESLVAGKLVVVSTASTPGQFDAVLAALQTAARVPVVPVTLHEPTAVGQRITIGPALPDGASQDTIRAAVLHQLQTGEPLPLA
jgi:MFS family permease